MIGICRKQNMPKLMKSGGLGPVDIYRADRFAEIESASRSEDDGHAGIF